MGQLDQDTQRWVQDTVTRAFHNGQAGAIYAIGEATSLTEAASLASFSLLARHTVESLVNDTYNDLLIATQNTEKKIKQLVRSVVSDTMRVMALKYVKNNPVIKPYPRTVAKIATMLWRFEDGFTSFWL